MTNAITSPAMSLYWLHQSSSRAELLTILSIDEFCGLQVEVNGKRVYADASELRTATTAELKAKRRLPAPVALFIPHWGMDDPVGRSASSDESAHLSLSRALHPQGWLT